MNYQCLDIPKNEISFLNNKLTNYCLIIPVINEGKNIQLILGRDLFIKGFDDQLLGVKKNENKLS